jgi:O-methyltransferase involved in polyketide biosynthesis
VGGTLFDAISYDHRKFGKPNQSHALRALGLRAAARDYLTTHPKASGVALAEGLQTSFWRLDRVGAADELNWYSVDLPPVMALRAQLPARDERITELAQSALTPVG